MFNVFRVPPFTLLKADHRGPIHRNTLPACSSRIDDVAVLKFIWLLS